MNGVQRCTFELRESGFECLSCAFARLSLEETRLISWSANLHFLGSAHSNAQTSRCVMHVPPRRYDVMPSDISRRALQAGAPKKILLEFRVARSIYGGVNNNVLW